MDTIKQFSEKERQYHAYQARQDYLRQQSSIQEELEQYRQEREQYRQELQVEKQEKEAALAKIEQLETLLAKQ